MIDLLIDRGLFAELLSQDRLQRAPGKFATKYHNRVHFEP
jgi:hypothetical protein